MKNKIKLIIAATLILCMTLSFASCGLFEDKGTYEMGKDSITSVKGVLGDLGERKMSGINLSTSNGVQTNSYTYTTDPNDEKQAAADMTKYFQYLCDQGKDGFLSLVSFDLPLPDDGGIDLRFAKNSVDEGKIILLEIKYDKKGYTLTFTKYEDVLTPAGGDDTE